MVSPTMARPYNNYSPFPLTQTLMSDTDPEWSYTQYCSHTRARTLQTSNQAPMWKRTNLPKHHLTPSSSTRCQFHCISSCHTNKESFPQCQKPSRYRHETPESTNNQPACCTLVIRDHQHSHSGIISAHTYSWYGKGTSLSYRPITSSCNVCTRDHITDDSQILPRAN